ncbi:MAG: winged helix-turn-helix transcriptional regulator [Methanomethylovorans sp.]|nr:winged helix-turn-helix transcriptional regulator [Methanomethylovorans sp.]
MMERKENLYGVFENLLKIKNECSYEIFSECGISDITVKQIEYLKTIDEHGKLTFTGLAQITKNSKPTITEMINKFVKMECAYREKSAEDGRIYYICLTEKGQMIARSEKYALMKLIERISDVLEATEMETLIRILKKIK